MIEPIDDASIRITMFPGTRCSRIDVVASLLG